MKKTYWVSLVLLLCLTAWWMIFIYSPEKTKNTEYSWQKICEIFDKAENTSYAYDMVQPQSGQKVKRMYFAKMPNTSMRSEWINNWEKYVFISNEKWTYEYYPDKKTAYFKLSEKTASVDYKCSEKKIKEWGVKIIGQDIVDGDDCYLFEYKMEWWVKPVECRSIKSGQKTRLEWITSQGKRTLWYYKNYEFDLSDDLFEIPKDVTIINQ